MPVHGRYQLERRIEQGRFDATYAAIDLAQEGAARRVTLTLLPASIAASNEAWSLFRDNCEWLAHLSHESIASVYDCAAGATGCYVVSEFVDGESLRNIVDQLAPEPLERDEADIVVRAVGMALAHAHDRGVAHGDVAAENVVVTADRRIKLIGFAGPQRCRPFDTDTATASDVHALAALAYELLSGQAPAVRPDRAAIAHLPHYRQLALAAGLSANGNLGVREFLAQMRLGDPPAPRRTSRDAAPYGSPARTEPRITPSHLEPGPFSPREVAASPRRDLAAAQQHRDLPVAPPRRRAWGAGFAGVALAVVAFNAGDPGEFAAMSSGSADQSLPGDDAAREPAVAAVTDAGSNGVRSDGTDDAIRNDALATGPETGADAGTATASASASGASSDTDSGSGTGRTSPPARRGAGYGTAASSLVAALPRQLATVAAEPLPLIRIESARMDVIEGQTMARIDVELGPAADAVTIAWWTESGTAARDEDYGDLGRRLERLDRTTTPALALVVPIVSDEIPEPAERFFVHVEAAPQDGSRVEKFRVEVAIRDDDASRPPPPRD